MDLRKFGRWCAGLRQAQVVNKDNAVLWPRASCFHVCLHHLLLLRREPTKLMPIS